MEFTVIGDTVNRAARLESLTRSLGATLLFDRQTAERLGKEAGKTGQPGEASTVFPTVFQGVHPIKGLGDVEVFSPGGQGAICQARPAAET
jgi:class 3 adenylate cyclase